jgi:hypothetical protein
MHAGGNGVLQIVVPRLAIDAVVGGFHTNRCTRWPATLSSKGMQVVPSDSGEPRLEVRLPYTDLSARRVCAIRS